MKSQEFRASVVSFLISFIVLFTASYLWIHFESFTDILLFLLISLIPISGCAGLFQERFKISICAGALGSSAAFGLCLSLWTKYELWIPFGCYWLVMSIFHWSEYVTTCVTSPTTLSFDSFLLNHSKEYWIAAVSSWIEFLFEMYFLPRTKTYTLITALGLLLCIVGECLRKAAMITAGSNFTHVISTRKLYDHDLVTRGIYSLFRHPSYVGWFWWSIGTQVILCNPFCLIAYSVVSWRFFKERIYEEEILLINFFGVEYYQYKNRVPTGLPFIEGYKPDRNDV